MKRLRWSLAALSLLIAPSAKADVIAQAKAMLAAGHLAQAAQLLQQQTNNKPDDARAWFLLGVAQARRKHYQEAISAFRRAAQLMPNNPAPHNNLAVIYNELGDARAAAEALEHAVALAPKDAAAWENLAHVYLKLSLHAYQRAQSLAPSAALGQRIAALRALRSSLSMPLHTTAAQPKAPKKERARGEPVQTSAQAAPAAPPKAPSEQEQTKQAVLAAVERWRAAWQARDIDGYLAAYSKDFRPPARFASRAAWARYKRRVILGKRFIRVRLDDLQLELEKDRARVRFVQHYASDNYEDRTRKELVLKKEGDAWRIVEERVL